MKCPHCAADIEITPGIVSYSCSYCRSVIVRGDDDQWTETGKQSVLVPFPTTVRLGQMRLVANTNSNDRRGDQAVNYLTRRQWDEMQKLQQEKKMNGLRTVDDVVVTGHWRLVSSQTMTDLWIARPSKQSGSQGGGFALLFESDGMVTSMHGSYHHRLDTDQDFAAPTVGSTYEGAAVMEVQQGHIDGRDGQLPFHLPQQGEITLWITQERAMIVWDDGVVSARR